MNPVLEELRSLLDALVEEKITPEQSKRLEEILARHPEAETYYIQYMNLVADISRHFASPPATIAPAAANAPDGQKAVNKRGKYLVIFGGLTAIAASFLVAIALWPRPIVLVTNQPTLTSERVDDSVAVLLQTHKAEWEDTGLPTRPGSPLPPGRLVLKSGYAHLEFYNGATVILEGPAEFQLISRTQAFCQRGKLRATVPPQAHGFAIGSPSMDLIDRGTEFGLSVVGGKSEVHVFHGQVDVYEPGSSKKALKEVLGGHAVSRDQPGAMNAIRPDSKSFLTVDEMTAQAIEATRQRQREWTASSLALREDPSLVAYYTFQENPPRSRSLSNVSTAQANAPHGAIVGCQWAAGRWQGRDALEFKRVSDRVRLKVPGEFESLTLSAWVRPDALPNQNNAILMADGWETGAIHWQIGVDGTIILGVKAPRELEGGPMNRGAHYRAYNVFTPERLGRWVHLTLVYDSAAERVAHYVDGKLVADYETEFHVPLKIGDAEVGNWNAATFRNKHPVRNFNGCIDEFMLFSRALTQVEVERLHTQGRPPG
jgi:hypothetical protein